MNLSWTITDKRYEHKPWTRETFQGYFTDIRRAARKSLPRKPGSDLCNILGITLSPGRLEPEAASIERRLSDSASSAPVALKPVISQTVDSPQDGSHKDKQGTLDKLKDILLCRNSKTENCSKREKTVFGFAIYFAIITFILLIIVLILSMSLSSLADDDSDTNAQLVGPSTSSTTRQSSISTDKTTPSSTRKRTSIRTVFTGAAVSNSSRTTPTNLPPTSVLTSSSSFSKSKVTLTVSAATTASIVTTTSSSFTSSLLESTSRTSVSVDTSGKTTNSLKTLKSSSIKSSSRSSQTLTASSHSTKVSLKTNVSTSTPTVSPSSLNISSSKTTETFTSPFSFSTSASASTTESSREFPTLENTQISCTSHSCLAAKNTLKRVDLSKSPCADFYEFSCGNWSMEWTAREEENEKNIPKSIQDEMRQGLLLEIKAMQEVHALLDPLGMHSNGSIHTSLESLLRDAVSRFEVTPFFRLSHVTVVNEDGVKVQGLKIRPPSVFLDHNQYSQPVEMGTESFRYVEGMSQVLFSYLSTFNPRQTRQTADGTASSVPSFAEIFNKVLHMYYIEANISKILENTTIIGDEWYETQQYTVAKLRKVYPVIDWDAALGQSRNFHVHLVNSGYFQQLNSLWSDFDDEDTKLYVFVSILAKRIWTYMKRPFRMLLSNVGKNGDMIYSDIDCVDIALSLASEEIHALYIGQYTQKVLNNRVKLTNLEDKISEHFLNFVSTTEWIQSNLERAVTSLANNLKMQFSGIVANIRQTRNITGESQSFLSLAVELHRQKYNIEMSRLGSEVSEIQMDWTSSRPYFDAGFNAIGMPTGLTVYMGTSDVPFDFYGYAGMVIATEFLQLLTGTMKGGSPPQWWGTNNIRAFDPVRQCFSVQLTSVQNMHYDIGNVIIQNGAYQIMNQVYLSASPNNANLIPGTSIAENMLFTINVAQLHCQLEDTSYESRLIRDRVNNMIRNNANLKKMFGCPDASPMVTEDTCSLF